jgi:hypothetical protein
VAEDKTPADVTDEPAVAGEAAHVQQARAELAEALRLGNQESATAARKRLAAAGVDPDAGKKVAAARRAAAAKDNPAARSTPPAGRSTREGKASKT